MTIIAHRGWWRGDVGQQNSPEAIAGALGQGWGVEIDARWNGVGHDEVQWSWSDVAPAFRAGDGPILIDMKDGELELSSHVAAFLQDDELQRRMWFFDMELLSGGWCSDTARFRYLARASDRDEPLAAALTQPWARGVWLDTFTTPWVTPDVLQQCRDAGKVPFIVSPELHGQPIDLAQWASWGDAAVCTDLPHLLARLRAGGPEMVPKEAWW